MRPATSPAKTRITSLRPSQKTASSLVCNTTTPAPGLKGAPIFPMKIDHTNSTQGESLLDPYVAFVYRQSMGCIALKLFNT